MQISCYILLLPALSELRRQNRRPGVEVEGCRWSRRPRCARLSIFNSTALCIPRRRGAAPEEPTQEMLNFDFSVLLGKQTPRETSENADAESPRCALYIFMRLCLLKWTRHTPLNDLGRLFISFLLEAAPHLSLWTRPVSTQKGSARRPGKRTQAVRNSGVLSLN